MATLDTTCILCGCALRMVNYENDPDYDRHRLCGACCDMTAGNWYAAARGYLMRDKLDANSRGIETIYPLELDEPYDLPAGTLLTVDLEQLVDEDLPDGND